MNHARLLGKMLLLNLQGAMEYRLSFLLQVVLMGLNNLVFMGFWWLFFDRFHSVEGWNMERVSVLFSMGACAFGLARIPFGNLSVVSRKIGEGQLDLLLSQPKDPLLKLLAGRTSAPSMGDVLFGILLFGGATSYGWGKVPGMLMLAGLAASVLTSLGVIFHSLAFLMGRAEGVSSSLDEALLTFSLYPEGLFTGGVRFALFTVLPAAWVTWIPVSILEAPRFSHVLGYLTVVAGLAWVARRIFEAGLRQYESGNQMVTNV
jgi:ABC-2 type transport system permease protein